MPTRACPLSLSQVLIYVFDIESRELAKDMEYYASCLQAVRQNSKSAKVFCLVHKMDLVPEEQREEVSSMSALLQVMERLRDNVMLVEDYLARRGLPQDAAAEA